MQSRIGARFGPLYSDAAQTPNEAAEIRELIFNRAKWPRCEKHLDEPVCIRCSIFRHFSNDCLECKYNMAAIAENWLFDGTVQKVCRDPQIQVHEDLLCNRVGKEVTRVLVSVSD